VFFSRLTKMWVFITLFALLAYELYWLRDSAPIIYSLFYFYLQFRGYELWAFAGVILRVVGVSSAIVAACLVWGPKRKTFYDVKRLVVLAVLFEGGYYLLFAPSVPRLTNAGLYVFGAAYALQILFKAPFLISLGFRIWNMQEGENWNHLLSWISAVCIAYLCGIWVINVLNWLSMTSFSSFVLLLRGINGLGFLDSVVTLSTSLVFAVAGFYTLRKGKNRKMGMRLLSLALIFVGLHFVFFLVFSAIVNAWKFVLLTEIWPITFLGLGLSMLMEEI
jgi:hypothetical protein